ncbi:MAG: amidohydrolase family protein [Lewinella sp.]|nr:amidohydrolase family protein [Lewinella sp.]
MPFLLSAQTTYLHCGRLFDATNLELQTEMTVIVTGNTISRVEKGYLTPETEAIVIDLTDQTVMPGLMDMHVHIEGESNPSAYLDRFRMDAADVALRSTLYARRTLEAGFTTVRDLGGTGVNVSLRDAINRGYVEGPRIVTAEKAIGTTGGHADPTNGLNQALMGSPGPAEGVINSAADAREAVRQRYKNGADCIKITATGGVLSLASDGSGPQFVAEELDAIVATARDYGMHTAAHAHGKEGMMRAIRAGITSIEHGTLMDEEVMAAMIEHGTYYVPTISAGRFVAEKAEEEGYFPEVIRPKARAIGPQIQATFAAAYRAGVKIAFGTDTGVSPHGDNANEFIYMVEGGMPPAEAIRSATVTASELIGRSGQLGTIEVGKLADIVAVPGNPLEDISVMTQVSFVMKDGVVYKQ